ncbi:hypothetical protein Dsin_006971 [Dipteronia sinensis]|uniref:Uncharacterized protein n=1 Tax=Dipteronia sinensis TaxID=43782 RepID=A0AAE0EGE5_9ROSI|nr:hypothetical protein Dsin_006971 [Dipteronia sinensis]
MDEAKEEISKNLKGELGAYKEIWDIINKRWEFQMHRHLHAAAYFMYPQYQYTDNFSIHSEVHTKRRNSLTTTRMHKLVYVMYNKKLKDRHLRRKKLKENEDPLVLDRVPSDDEWMVDEANVNDGRDDDFDFNVVGGDVTTLTNNNVNFGTSSKKRNDPPTKDKGKGLTLIDDEDDELIDHIMDGEADISVGHDSDSSLNLSSDEE